MSKPAAVLVVMAIVACGREASAQTLSDVLSFLLTNRTVATDDFVRDQQAAKAASDAMSAFLLINLNTLPITTSAGGFTYRFDRTIGASVRSTDSFDPFFTRRALTAGAKQLTLGISYQQSTFQTIDGRALQNGTLISTASRLRGDTDYFDVETLAARLEMSTATLVGDVGVTDRFEVGAALPIVRITLDGQRQDTYRGRPTLQASAHAATSGPGDLLVQGKYEVLRESRRGVALGAQVRLPSGNPNNLLGTGKMGISPLLIASLGDERASVHGNVGYAVSGRLRSLDFSGAGTAAVSSRLTVIAELLGHRISNVGRLTDIVAPHPTLSNVETVRLTSTDQGISRVMVVGGVKWNLRSTWLLSANIVRPLTDSGLNAAWTPTITVDYSFGQ